MKKYFITILILLSVVVNLIAAPVYALTESKTVSGEGTLLGGSYIGGAGDFTNLNSDDWITYWFGTTDLDRTWNITDTAIVGTINSVTLYLKTDSVYGVETAQFETYIGSTLYYGSSFNAGGGVSHAYTWNTNPSTGLSWTVAGFNSAQFGVKTTMAGGASPGIGLYYMYLVIDYSSSVPSVTATIPITYTDISATLIGNITAEGSSTPDNYGFVWGTVDQGDPGNLAPANGIGGWTKGWAVGAGSYGVAQYTHATGATLVINTTYYIRFAAHNSIGWEYSSVVSFRTLTNPSITTLAATNVASTTVRLNASVVDDGKLGGGENCTVDFVYVAGNYATYALISGDGAHVHVSAAGTYNTGDLPYYNLAGLTISTQYSFASSITNSISTQYGNPALQFTTISGVFIPTNFVAIPTSTTISLSWVKGVGASNTFIRYDTSTYPANITSGLGTVYAGVSSAYTVTGLTPGQNYYFSAWGLTGGAYSGTPATYDDGEISVMATCLAYSPEVVPALPTPTTPGSWNLTPSTAAISNMPFSEFVNYFADSYDMPRTTMWYGLIIMFSVGAGLFTYWRGNKNILPAILICAIGLALGAVVWGLVYLWVLVFFLMAGIAMTFFGMRYPN